MSETASTTTSEVRRPDPTAATVTLADDLVLTRMGYGAMQLAGPGAWGPPRVRDAALAVLRTVVELGLNHVDTSDFYGPHVVNEIIREALHPYPDGLHIVTKVGAARGTDQSWRPALGREDLVAAVHANLDHLGLDVLDVVNLRMGADPADSTPVSAPMAVLAQLQQQGLIRHLGVSNVSAQQLAQAQQLAPVVCVQNHYNLAHRADDALLDTCAAQGIAFTPFFPLGGFTPLQSDALSAVAARLEASVLQVSLAWLLQRSPSILLIPGTSSVAHLRDNVAAASLELPDDAVRELDAIGT